MEIRSIKPQIMSLGQFYQEEASTLQIPSIQRQFVWDAEDIKDLLDSIINGYPIGAIIVWEPTTQFPSAPLMGKDLKVHTRRYILDGQQRLTALMLVMNHWQIQREDKTIRTSTISYVPETNRLYTSGKKGIDVSLIVNAAQADVDSLVKLQKEHGAVDFKKAIESVGKKIVNYQLPIYILESVSDAGEDTYEKIAEIFTRVNSAGVKIGNLEMFLSFFAAAFPKKEKDKIISMHEEFSVSFELDLEPLIRFVFSRMGMDQNQITKVQSFRKAIHTLKEKYSKELKKITETLNNSETSIRTVLELLDSEFGICSTQFVPSQNVLIPLFDFTFQHGYCGAKDIPRSVKNKMLYWFLVASFNGTYSSSPNYKIDDDLGIIREGGEDFPVKELIKLMKNRPPYRGDIERNSVVNVYSNVLRGRAGKEYLMLLDVLLYRKQATDWASKTVKSEKAAIHHIFPREFLKENGETRDEMINCLANLTFIDPDINSEIGDNAPGSYFKDYVGKDESIFEKHMIPSKEEFWLVDNYEKFLEARAKLIWQNTSDLLDELQK